MYVCARACVRSTAFDTPATLLEADVPFLGTYTLLLYADVRIR